MKRRVVLMQRPTSDRRRLPHSPDVPAGPRDLNELLAQAIRQSLEQQADQACCACGLSEKSRKEMVHLVGVLQDVGEGSLARGLEHLREALKSHLAYRKRFDRALMAAATILIGALTSAGLAALWLGFQHHFAERAVH